MRQRRGEEVRVLSIPVATHAGLDDGTTEYLDEDDNVVVTSDARSNLDTFYAAREAAGVPRPTAILT